MSLAPIVLFVYNRPWHTQQSVEALAQNALASQSDLIVFADGPKSKKDQQPVKEVRKYVHSIQGFRSVTIHESPVNKGLASSIIAGVTQVLVQADTIIVLEDDLVTSSFFLQYMNVGLRLYEKQEEVISIHGYIYPVEEILPETFFLKGADCWGWATWRRGWLLFEQNGSKLLTEIEKRKLARDFDFNGTYPYTKMLRNQIRGANDSWAIRWYASAFLADKLTLYPGRSLVHNIGNDRSGTHSEATSRFDTEISAQEIVLEKISLEENKEAKQAIAEYYKRKEPSFYSKVMNRIKSLPHR